MNTSMLDYLCSQIFMVKLISHFDLYLHFATYSRAISYHPFNLQPLLLINQDLTSLSFPSTILLWKNNYLKALIHIKYLNL